MQSGVLVTVALSGALGAALLGGGPQADGGCAEAQAAPAGASAVEGRLNCATACQASALVPSVPPRLGRGVRLRFNGGSRRAVRVSIYRLTRGRRVVPNRLVIAFGPRRKAFRWSGRVVGGPCATVTTRPAFARGATRAWWRCAAAAPSSGDCPPSNAPALRRAQRLPAWRTGLRRCRAQAARHALPVEHPGRVSIVVTKGRRTIKRVRSRSRAPGKTYRVRVRTRTRGTVRVTLTARIGRKTVRSRLYARGL